MSIVAPVPEPALGPDADYREPNFIPAQFVASQRPSSYAYGWNFGPRSMTVPCAGLAGDNAGKPTVQPTAQPTSQPTTTPTTESPGADGLPHLGSITFAMDDSIKPIWIGDSARLLKTPHGRGFCRRRDRFDKIL